MAEFNDTVRDLAWLDEHGALDGVREIIRERRRQIEHLAWTPEHDKGVPNLQIAPFPVELRRRLKAACALSGLKLYEGAIAAIEAWTAAREKENTEG